MEEQGILILVTGVECRYRRSARYDDAIRVRARMSELSRRGLAFDYEIAGAEGGLLADGSTRHVFADREGRPKSVATEILEAMERFRRS
jgi:acyl-CoA thioester hydrolase